MGAVFSAGLKKYKLRGGAFFNTGMLLTGDRGYSDELCSESSLWTIGPGAHLPDVSRKILVLAVWQQVCAGLG